MDSVVRPGFSLAVNFDSRDAKGIIGRPRGEGLVTIGDVVWITDGIQGCEAECIGIHSLFGSEDWIFLAPLRAPERITS